MLTLYPDYYPQFKCIATLCRHNCCIGWEIDIDSETAAKYAAVDGEMGARLRANIAHDDDPPHFILGEGERCPFLNSSNLCDLILHGGEWMLCQICADHPRFRNELPGRTELGLGLCCEAAARLIIDRREPVGFILAGVAEEKHDGYAAALVALRDELIAAAQDRSRPVWMRADAVLDLCGLPPLAVPPRQLARLYLGLERLDDAWTGRLAALYEQGDNLDLAAFDRHMTGREHEFEQLLVYFLYRHVAGACDDGDITGRAALAVLSLRLIYLLGAVQFAQSGRFSADDMAELARMYSSEVEYSDENVDALLDALA